MEHLEHFGTVGLGNDRTSPTSNEYCGTVKEGKKYRGFFITAFNNTDQYVLEQLEHFNGKKIVGSETCPTTGRPHHHIYLYCKSPIHWSSIKRIFNDSKIEIAKGKPQHSIKYLSKQNLIQNDYQELTYIYAGEDLPAYKDLYQWELFILQYTLKDKPNNRELIWIYEKDGKTGKTIFGKYLEFHHKNVCYTTISKSADILTCAEPHYRMYYLDFPRTLGENFQPFNALEQLLNGAVDDCKLKKTRRKIRMRPPWVIVVSNHLPQADKLSKDRITLFTIKNNKELYYKFEKEEVKC